MQGGPSIQGLRADIITQRNGGHSTWVSILAPQKFDRTKRMVCNAVMVVAVVKVDRRCPLSSHASVSRARCNARDRVLRAIYWQFILQFNYLFSVKIVKVAFCCISPMVVNRFMGNATVFSPELLDWIGSNSRALIVCVTYTHTTRPLSSCTVYGCIVCVYPCDSIFIGHCCQHYWLECKWQWLFALIYSLACFQLVPSERMEHVATGKYEHSSWHWRVCSNRTDKWFRLRSNEQFTAACCLPSGPECSLVHELSDPCCRAGSLVQCLIKIFLIKTKHECWSGMGW